MKITAAYACAQGKVRTQNQDNLYFHGEILKLRHTDACSRMPWRISTKRAVCFGVFDGMGGEQYGETASFLAAKTWKTKMLAEKAGKIPADILNETCHLANQIIYNKTLELKAKRIGSTGAAVYMQYDRIWYCNVGDSRIYRLRGKSLTQLSCDHTRPYADNSGRKPGLTQHLGMNPVKNRLMPYLADDKIEAGDRYLLCSDGLTDMVQPEEIKNILLQNTSMKRCAKTLLKYALKNGGVDNITAIVFQVKA